MNEMMPCREALLQSIHPKMHLTKAFFLRVYGYEVSTPGFAEQALSALEAAGCSRAREYYNTFTGECERQREEELKRVAAWYREYKKGYRPGSRQTEKEGDTSDMQRDFKHITSWRTAG